MLTVILPCSKVVLIVKTAYANGIPLIAFSGGSEFTQIASAASGGAHVQHMTASVEGQFDSMSIPATSRRKVTTAVPLESLERGHSLVIDFSEHMNNIIAVHDRDLDVVVQPGVPYETLNDILAKDGLFFPVDVRLDGLNRSKLIDLTV